MILAMVEMMVAMVAMTAHLLKVSIKWVRLVNFCHFMRRL